MPSGMSLSTMLTTPRRRPAFGLGRGVGLCAFGLRLAIVQIFRLHNLDGNTVIDEGVAHGLAGAQVRSREDDGVAVGGEALQLAEYFVGHPGHIDALHRQLVVQRAADPHDGDISGPHLAPEVQRRRLGEQARRARCWYPGALGDVLRGMGRVIEERARLDEGRARARPRIGAQRHRFLVQKRQHHIGAVEAKPPFELLQHVAQSRVGERRLLQGAARVGQRTGGGGKFRDGVDLHRGQRGDGLARGWHDAADLVQLVAEEVEAHRIGQVAGEHVHGAAAHGEGARAVQLAGVGVAAASRARGRSPSSSTPSTPISSSSSPAVSAIGRAAFASTGGNRRRSARALATTTTSRPLLSAKRPPCAGR